MKRKFMKMSKYRKLVLYKYRNCFFKFIVCLFSTKFIFSHCILPVFVRRGTQFVLIKKKFFNFKKFTFFFRNFKCHKVQFTHCFNFAALENHGLQCLQVYV